jgi:hypothetical protein
MADESANSMDGARFYYEPWVDRKNRLRTKTVCIQKITINHESQETEIHYAYGSTVLSVNEEYREGASKKIAKQRAEKALERFGGLYRFDFKFYNAHDGYEGCIGYRPWMNILTPGEFSELEKKLLPFNEKPKEAKIYTPKELLAEVQKEHSKQESEEMPPRTYSDLDHCL